MSHAGNAYCDCPDCGCPEQQDSEPTWLASLRSQLAAAEADRARLATKLSATESAWDTARERLSAATARADATEARVRELEARRAAGTAPSVAGTQLEQGLSQIAQQQQAEWHGVIMPTSERNFMQSRVRELQDVWAESEAKVATLTRERDELRAQRDEAVGLLARAAKLVELNDWLDDYDALLARLASPGAAPAGDKP